MKLKTFKTLQYITCTLPINSSNLVFRKKETFACVIFSKIGYDARVINCAGKLVYLHACWHEHNHAVLIDKPVLLRHFEHKPCKADMDNFQASNFLFAF